MVTWWRTRHATLRSANAPNQVAIRRIHVTRRHKAWQWRILEGALCRTSLGGFVCSRGIAICIARWRGSVTPKEDTTSRPHAPLGRGLSLHALRRGGWVGRWRGIGEKEREGGRRTGGGREGVREGGRWGEEGGRKGRGWERVRDAREGGREWTEARYPHSLTPSDNSTSLPNSIGLHGDMVGKLNKRYLNYFCFYFPPAAGR